MYVFMSIVLLQESVGQIPKQAAGLVMLQLQKKRAKKDKENESNPSNGVTESEVSPLLSTPTEVDGAAHSSIPVSSNTTTGRSSFWERRKVWNIHELLAETEHIQPTAARNIVQLFENENTIPFICRYYEKLLAVFHIIKYICVLPDIVATWLTI